MSNPRHTKNSSFGPLTIDPYTAYLEAIDGVIARERGETGKWSHPAIYWASVRIGAFDLKSKSYSQLKRRWMTALAEELIVPHPKSVPPSHIAHKRCAPRPSPAAARKLVNQLRMTMTKSKYEVRDPKRWARRIQARIAAGDDSITRLQAEAARRALNQ